MRKILLLTVICLAFVCANVFAESTDSLDVKKWSVDFSGYCQVQFNGGDPIFHKDGFFINRLRPVITGIYGDKLTGKVMGQLGGKFTLLMAYFDYQLIDSSLIVRVGQFASRSMYIARAPEKMVFIQSQLTDHYIREKNPTGIEIWGDYRQLHWAIHVTNGVKENHQDNNDQKDITFYSKIKLAKGLTLSGCYQQGEQPDTTRQVAWFQVKSSNKHFDLDIGVITRHYHHATSGWYTELLVPINERLTITQRLCQRSLERSKTVMVDELIATDKLEYTIGVDIQLEVGKILVNAITGGHRPIYAAQLQFNF